jgi:hypothetical protein
MHIKKYPITVLKHPVALICVIRVIKSRRMRWAGHAARMGARRNAYRILEGKPEGKKPLGRPRCRLVDNIKKIGRAHV